MGNTFRKDEHSDLVTDEVEAVEGYDQAIENETDPESKEKLEHIRSEELEHIDELEGMDKMTSDEAWNDFKSNYDPKEFEQAHKMNETLPESEMATVDGKLDTIASMINEVKVDTERVANVVPKLQAQADTQDNELESDAEGGIAEGGEETFGDDIDIFGDDEQGKGDDMADKEEGEGTPKEEMVDDQEVVDTESDKEGVPEEITESEEASDDKEQSEEDAESTEEEDEVEEEPTEDDELTEKMVKTIVKQSKQIKALEKQISDLASKVDRMEKSTKKSIAVHSPRREIRQPITKRVGVVSKPPVSSGYTGTYNRRDGESATADWSNPKSIVEGYKKQLQE